MTEAKLKSPLLRGVSIHREKPANLDAHDDSLFREGYSYKTFDVLLKDFGPAWVSPDSVVYRRGAIVTETVVTKEQIPYYRFRHLIKKFTTGKRVNLEDGRQYLLITDAWSAGHFHWLMEVLPKIVCLRESAGDFVLLLPDTAYTRTIGLESLEMLSIEFEDIIFMRKQDFYKVKSLNYIPRVAAPGQVNDQIMKELNQRLRSTLRVGCSKRFYISRSDARIRKVLNEPDLEAILKVYGFETIRPENHSLREQVSMFAECETMMGIHGSGLTNCLFMPPGGKVVELRKREPNYGYWHLADSVGHKYFYYHGVPDSDLSLIGRGCNLTIPVDDFEKKILSRFA